MTVERTVADVLVERGWELGTTLENRVALRLSRWGWTPADIKREHRVGRYRLDFAWPAVMVGLEADGWHHRSPEGAARDAARDAWLRRQGWLVLRVDDHDTLDDQLLRVHLVVVGLGVRPPRPRRHEDRSGPNSGCSPGPPGRMRHGR